MSKHIWQNQPTSTTLNIACASWVKKIIPIRFNSGAIIMTKFSTDTPATATMSALKWFAVLLSVPAWTTSWADNSIQAAKSDELVKTAAVIAKAVPATVPLTTFVDGPTGYVFVYTAEGWKFVRATKN
jgi:hypothetical protein